MRKKRMIPIAAKMDKEALKKTTELRTCSLPSDGTIGLMSSGESMISILGVTTGCCCVTVDQSVVVVVPFVSSSSIAP